MPSTSSHTKDIETCIQECFNCHRVCLETINLCLKKGGKHAGVTHVQLLSTCAEICHTSTKVMLADSEFSKQLCTICADVCEQCEKRCATFSGDAEMKNCAETCRRCAHACRQMSSVQAA